MTTSGAAFATGWHPKSTNNAVASSFLLIRLPLPRSFDAGERRTCRPARTTIVDTGRTRKVTPQLG
ncbi:hypothetical protein GCM10022267_20940 [Lentzea roselyniae]|uniref:Uncharacterized protein n=1 Tax=Lentzea roselyniae TaxID=531940 RepID=A0ABP7AJF0_9PSEU